MDDWKNRAIEATHANGSQLGAILLAVLGRTPRHPPAFGLGAVISSDGMVFCDFVTHQGELKTGAFVCDTEELRDNFRGLADYLKLSDAERLEMFKELGLWIKKDWRADVAGKINLAEATR